MVVFDQCRGAGSRGSRFVVRTSLDSPVPSRLVAWCFHASVKRRNESYLVDPASSHMLVSKTKPCMSKFKRFKR